MERKKIKKNWLEFERACRLIADYIENLEHDNKYIYGISRGGFPIATYVSNLLNIPMVHSTQELTDKLRPNFGNDSILIIVDDICDSGDTLESKATKFLKNPLIQCVSTAVWYHRDNNVHTPDFHVEIIPKKLWIVFPWERGEERSIGKKDRSEVGRERYQK